MPFKGIYPLASLDNGYAVQPYSTPSKEKTFADSIQLYYSSIHQTATVCVLRSVGYYFSIKFYFGIIQRLEYK